MSKLQELLDEIHKLEERVLNEISRESEEFGYSIKKGRIYFEKEILQYHKEHAQRVVTYLSESSWPSMVTVPVIYSLLFPILLFDIFLFFYQAICFPVYGIPKVKRKGYFVYDRKRLKYLNIIERLHCRYCSYAIGVISYAQEVAARTEQYWCPIKHAQRIKSMHSRYSQFLPYGDAESYATKLETLRKQYTDLQ